MMRQQQLALDIDLYIPDWFGWWFSGLADGEGCFELYTPRNQRCLGCRFNITLRADDLEVLELIWSMLHIGRITVHRAQKTIAIPNQNPGFRWAVSRVDDLQWILIPLLEKYPLQSKKAKDFEIWKRGIRLVMAVRAGNKRCCWTDALWEIALRLASELKKARVYNPKALENWLMLHED